MWCSCNAVITNNMNSLESLSEKLQAPIKSQQKIDVSGEVSYYGISKTYRKYRIRIDMFKTFHSLTVNVNSGLAMAVNTPGRMFAYKVPVRIENSPYIVYLRDDVEPDVKDDKVKGFLKDIFSFLKEVEFSPAESAFFYNNGISFVLDLSRDVKAMLDEIIEIINRHPLVFATKSKSSISKKNIPEKLRPLFPYLSKYAVSDDSIRSELVDGMSAKKKKELIDAVKPLFSDINSHINSFGDTPLTEEAMLIGNLAELVSELIV